MASTEVDIPQWKQGIRNKSMDILKAIQKLLAICKDTDTPSASVLAPLSTALTKSSNELQSDLSYATPEDLKKHAQELNASLTTCIKLNDALQSKPSDEDIKTRIKNECKTIAGLIKLVNQLVQDLQESDIKPPEPTPPPSSPNSSPSNRAAEPVQVTSAAAPEWLNVVNDLHKKAEATLSQVETSALNKDQAGLVNGAKSLSATCTELLNHARDLGIASHMSDVLKEKILTVINVAKTVFKGGDDSAKKELEKATRSTLTLLKELHRAFEDHANDDSPHDELLDDETIAREASPEPRDKSPSPSPNSSLDKRSSPRDQPVAASEAKVPVPPPAAGSTSAAKPPSDVLSPKDASKQLQKEFSSRDPEKVFKVQELLGEGATGSVYRAIHRETKKVVAIKKMQVGVNNIAATVKEIKIMKDLKSPYTLKYYGCYQKDDSIWLIMEYADGGSVQDIIDAREDEDVCLTEAQIVQITAQVLKALEYLHSMKKIHRDIKAGNILLNSKGMAKLADFGISAQQIGDEKRTTTIGSSYWMAPETLMGAGYDSKADIWSLGITLLEMAEGMPPLIEEAPHKAAFRIVNDPPPKLSNPEAWSPLFNDFLAACLVKNPDERPTASQLLQHPFIKQAEGSNNAAIVELLAWVQKHRKKNKKGGFKKSKADLEDEASLSVYFGENDSKVSLLVPGHVTVEDVCRNCSEQFPITKDPKAYSLFLVIEDGSKVKEKPLGTYDYPVKILKHMEKKLGKKVKTASGREPVRFIYKAI